MITLIFIAVIIENKRIKPFSNFPIEEFDGLRI